jgi:hypothetical protein
MLDTQKLKERIEEISLNLPEERADYVIPANDDTPRKYLGASAIGEECTRRVWYQYRHCVFPKFPGRMKRLFRRGDREEFVFIYLLRLAGITVHEKDENGKQFRILDFDGHLSGHMDGVGEAPQDLWIGKNPYPFLLEFKSYNDSRFSDLRKQGVAISDPKYYDQIQLYMGHEGLEGTLFCAVNKNDDELHFCWVPFSSKAFGRIMAKAEDILSAESPPKRMRYASPSYFKCKYCDAKDLCFKGTPSVKSCRSCKHGYPSNGGVWECAKGKPFGELCGDYRDIAKED